VRPHRAPSLETVVKTVSILLVAASTLLVAGAALHRDYRTREALRSREARTSTTREARLALAGAVLRENGDVLAAALLGLLIGVEASALLSYGVARPLRRLAWGFRQLAAGRHPRLPEGALAPREIAALTRDFNEMAEQVDRWREVQRQVARMDRLAGLGEVASGLAHEIRNPLAGMRIHLDLLSEEVRSPAGAESLVLLGQELDRLNQVVTQLLSFARPSPPVPTLLDPRELLDWTVRMIRVPAQRQGVRVEVRADPACGPIRADGNQIRQVLLNLALNALQAMPDGGTLLLDAARREGSVRLRVRDTGQGVSPALRERIFDPFFTTRNEGTGLGLSIAHRLVEGGGGRIEPLFSPEGTEMALVWPAPPDREDTAGGRGPEEAREREGAR